MRPVRVAPREGATMEMLADPVTTTGLPVSPNVDRAERLVLVCDLGRARELREAVLAVQTDPEDCPRGEEFERIMQVYLRTPV